MKNWMKQLACHYEKMRNRYPNDRLLLLFDIDGTIIDMRYMIHYVLQLYDQVHNTKYFSQLKIAHITFHENQLDSFLARLSLPEAEEKKILSWYIKQRWSSLAIYESHRPFSGVMEVIRWFQMQPNTYVGLNSGRPETLREDTLLSLNKLGRQYKVSFRDELIYLNSDPEKGIPESKDAGIFHFQRIGFRIVAFIDNEPSNLEVIAQNRTNKEILLLHADTIFESQRQSLPTNSMSGKQYDIVDLVRERSLPRNVQFVWHRVNDESNLRSFLDSNVEWAEVDVRTDPATGALVLRSESFESSPQKPNEKLLLLSDMFEQILSANKSIKLDIKEGGDVLDRLLALVEQYKINDYYLWFNGRTDVIIESGFQKLMKTHPLAIIQCPIDNLIFQMRQAPEEAHEYLLLLKSRGVNRFSLSWNTPDLPDILDQMDFWGFSVNIYNVPDLESFLKAVLLLPKSITSDFNFPKWNYFRRTTGPDRKSIAYQMDEQN
ncbi:MAG: hypothetical protein ACOY90_04520 [Candidatus Zhuqueibacterota bacterium]